MRLESLFKFFCLKFSFYTRSVFLLQQGLLMVTVKRPAGRGLTACKIADLGRKIEKKRDFSNSSPGHPFRTIFFIRRFGRKIDIVNYPTKYLARVSIQQTKPRIVIFHTNTLENSDLDPEKVRSELEPVVQENRLSVLILLAWCIADLG